MQMVMERVTREEKEGELVKVATSILPTHDINPIK